MLRFYNTLTRNIQDFKPINENQVGIYSCGPTVYWNQHLGNMYAYLQWDFLVRFFKYLGFKTKWVMNITDVGHMTSDEDLGEDKMEKGAKREGKTPWEIADTYIKQFTESMDLLNIQRPDVLCRATDHIADQIDLIKKIESRGFTYKTRTGLVFDTAKFLDYSKFAHLDLEKQDAGSRVEVDYEKKHPWDFLLWVTNQPEHIMKWESPWGVGFPGWHIECTAMSVKYLGENFDIHTGGKEHIPVHHTNEIAQGYGAFGHITANYWLHNEWLTLKGGEKISKSKGNFIIVQDLLNKGYDPLAMRYLVLTSHYRSGLEFSWESLDAAQKTLENLKLHIRSFKTEGGRTMLSKEKLEKVDYFRQKFISALENDLNTPQALAVLWEVIKSNLTLEDKYDLVLSFDEVLGLKLNEISLELPTVKIPEEISKLMEKREVLRKSGDFTKSDKIRKELSQKGYLVEDSDNGPVIKKLR